MFPLTSSYYPVIHLSTHPFIHVFIYPGVQQTLMKYIFWSGKYAKHNFYLLSHGNLALSLKGR